MNAVQEAARAVERAQFALAVAVRKSHDEGASLRQIAKDAGISHESVRRLIRSDQS